MYCSHCGKEIADGAKYCSNCGTSTSETPETFKPEGREESYGKERDASSIGYGILSFFFPIVGLILYIVWQEEFPLRAKSAGKGALISLFVQFLLFILGIIIFNLVMLRSIR